VLRHQSVEKVVMVDIDGEVVEMAKKDMLEWNKGVCDDPRLTIVYADALGYIENYDGHFDVIIMDIADPVDAGPGYMLYTKEFYEFAIRKMTPGGVFVTQCGGGSIHLVRDCFSNIHCTLKSVFHYVSPYTVDIPSFASAWAFTLAFNDGIVFDGKPVSAETFAGSDADTVDKLIEDRIIGELKFYDGVAHRGIFSLGKHVRKALAEETRIITKDDPVFVF
jgi:spermidine synthase